MGRISQAGLADIHPCGNLVLILPTDNCRLTLNGPRTLSFRHGWIHFWLQLTFILRCAQNIFLTWLWCNRITQMALPYNHSLGNKELSLAWNYYACTSQLYSVWGSMVTTPEPRAFNQSPLVKTTSVSVVKTGALFFLLKQYRKWNTRRSLSSSPTRGGRWELKAAWAHIASLRYLQSWAGTICCSETFMCALSFLLAKSWVLIPQVFLEMEISLSPPFTLPLLRPPPPLHLHKVHRFEQTAPHHFMVTHIYESPPFPPAWHHSLAPQLGWK